MDIVYLLLALFQFSGSLTGVILKNQGRFTRLIYFAPGFIYSEHTLAVMLALTVLFWVALTYFGLQSIWAIAGHIVLLATLVVLSIIYLRTLGTGRQLQRDLRDALGEEFSQSVPQVRRSAIQSTPRAGNILLPFKFSASDVEIEKNLVYDHDPSRHVLDVYYSKKPGGQRPLLLQVHGGAWTLGDKQLDARPLLLRMAQLGWLCASINYGLAPKHKLPEQIIDVKRAINWFKRHAHDWDGDASFCAITGGSAGGHLSALAALSADNKNWQPGFEDSDCSVNAAVHLYGIYDLLNREHTSGLTNFGDLMAENLAGEGFSAGANLFMDLSPVEHIHAAAPATYILHGTHDTLVPVNEGRMYAERLAAQSQNPVVYSELSGAQHAFDMHHSIRTSHTVDAIAWFLEYARCLER